MIPLPLDWLLQAALRATLLLGALFFVWKFLPASQPALRRRVLLVMAAGLLAAPWLSGWWTPVSPAPFAKQVAERDTEEVSLTWITALAGLWITGSLLALTRLAWQALALHQLIRRARPWRGDPALPAGLTVLQSPAISGPCVARGLRPVLLLPEQADHWTPAQWKMVLAHEQQHLQQQDPGLAWLPRLVHSLYWWHPLAHWLRHQFHAESEALCDRAVLARSGSTARDYVDFLLSLRCPAPPALASGMAMKSLLGQRLERLLASRSTPHRWWIGSTALLILTGLTALTLSLRTMPVAVVSAPPGPVGEAVTAGPESSGLDETALRLSANPFPAE